MAKTWLVTGASRCFGREIATAALRRGDKVAATARDASTLGQLQVDFGEALLPLTLDVTNRDESADAVAMAFDHFGEVDVVVNNAGYGHFGFIEELTETEARAQLETNVFGALWITQAAIPRFRSQGRGHFIQISSIGGVAAFPSLGIYHASKWALEGFSEALAQEVAPSGIKVTLVEPGGYSTDWSGSSATHSVPNPVYQPFRDAMAQAQALARPGEPAGVATLTLQVVDSPEPPLRVLAGSQAFDIAPAVYEQRLATWRAWESSSRGADHA
jgi:NAD(P)-dependent dehydrogenase (short-subunit alcohol dehydrogenase family)